MKKSLKALADAKDNGIVADEPANTPDSPQGEVKSFPDGLPIGISDLINMYSGKSETELMQELLQVTSRQKAEGVYDERAIQKTIETLAPMLSEEQRLKLNQITSKL